MTITIYPNTANIQIDYTHQQTHEGRFFSGGYYNGAVVNGASIDVLIQTDTKSPHLHMECSSVGDASARIYEGTTFSDAGSAVTMSNHNRTSTKTFVGTVTSMPTVTLTGTQVNGTTLLPGGTKNQATGTSFGSANEFILAPNTNYLIRLTNDSGSTTKMSISLQGYQPSL